MSRVKGRVHWAPDVVGPRADGPSSRTPRTPPAGQAAGPAPRGGLPAARRHRLAGVDDALGALSRAVADQARGRPRADIALVRAKLKAARVFSRIAHADDLTPDQANPFHALLEHASRLTLANAGHTDLSRRDAQVLHALLLMGTLHNRQRHHNGRGAQPEAPLVYGPGPKPAWVSIRVSKDGGQVVSRKLHATPAQARHTDVLAHEGTHLAHGNPPVDDGLPRQGMRELAAALPHHRAAAEDEAEEHEPDSEGAAHPRELHAMMEGAHVTRWAMDLDPGLLLDHGEAPDLGPPMPPALGMGRLAPLLVRAARDLNVRNPLKKLGDRLQPHTYKAVHDPRRHPEAGAHVQEILYATAEIHLAESSAAWTPRETATLNQTLADLGARLDGPGKRSGTQQLAEIAATLTRFMDELRATHGHALHAPRPHDGAVLTTPEFEALKASPNDVLQAVIEDIDERLAVEGNGFRLAPQAWPGAVEAAKAPFRKRLGGLTATVAKGQVPDAAALRDTVMALVAPLVGVSLRDMPPKTFPEIALIDAPSGPFPHVRGMNLAAGQRRKASFDPLAWQLNIPRELLLDPQRLESRLAGLAVDVAAAMSSLLIDDPQAIARLPQLQGLQQVKTLGDVQRGLRQVKPLADRYIAADHGSAAAVLRTFLSLHETHTDRLWHEGWRTGVKAARADDPVAREAYQARSARRWMSPMVAFRRALQGTARPQDEPGMPEEDEETEIQRAGPA